MNLLDYTNDIKTDWKEDKLMCRELKEDDISLVSDAMLSDFLKN